MGLEGLRKNEEFVAGVRQQIGDDCELMLDCWMAFDVEYTVRLAETLRPYRLKWLEECLLSEDFDAHVALRQRLPWQTLTTGEHWYTHVPFQWAINHRVIDILQPDINWCGGLSTCQRIAGAADAAGVSVMLHGGGNGPCGQHFSFATPSVPWLECFIGTPPGVPLEETWGLPGQAVPKDGWLVPNDAPGFGLELPRRLVRTVLRSVSAGPGFTGTVQHAILPQVRIGVGSDQRRHRRLWFRGAALSRLPDQFDRRAATLRGCHA